MTKPEVQCVPCAGKGFRWGRSAAGAPGRWAKQPCRYCKGTGKVKQK